MSNEVKFIDDEMKELKEIQEQYIKVQNEFGQLSVTKIRLQQQMDNILKFEDNIQSRFVETQNKEKEFISQITEKYGDGKLNAETGVFTKSETEEKEPEVKKKNK